MNIELNQAFYEYMEEIKKLDINDKKVEIINSLKETNALIDYLAEREQKQLQHIKSKEIAELNNGLENHKVYFEQEALLYIIRFYTREAGVRNLERTIASLCRKSVLAVLFIVLKYVLLVLS